MRGLVLLLVGVVCVRAGQEKLTAHHKGRNVHPLDGKEQKGRNIHPLDGNYQKGRNIHPLDGRDQKGHDVSPLDGRDQKGHDVSPLDGRDQKGRSVSPLNERDHKRQNVHPLDHKGRNASPLDRRDQKRRNVYPLDGRGAMSFVNPFFTGFGGRFHGDFPFGTYSQSFPAYHVPQMPYPYCQQKGQLLPHPTDRCRYLVCDYGHRAWRDTRGVNLYFAVERPCAPGTAVPKTFLGIVDIYDRKIVSPVWRKAFNHDHLCSDISQDCTLN